MATRQVRARPPIERTLEAERPSLPSVLYPTTRLAPSRRGHGTTSLANTMPAANSHNSHTRRAPPGSRSGLIDTPRRAAPRHELLPALVTAREGGVHVDVENALPPGLSPLRWMLAATCTGHDAVPCAYLIVAIIDVGYFPCGVHTVMRHCAVSH